MDKIIFEKKDHNLSIILKTFSGIRIDLRHKRHFTIPYIRSRAQGYHSRLNKSIWAIQLQAIWTQDSWNNGGEIIYYERQPLQGVTPRGP